MRTPGAGVQRRHMNEVMNNDGGAVVRIAIARVRGEAAAGDIEDVRGGEGGGWRCGAPRGEIAPRFFDSPGGGPSNGAIWRIAGAGRPGVNGSWSRTLPVEGGRWYRWQARFTAQGVPHLDRSVGPRIMWPDERGSPVPLDLHPRVRMLTHRAAQAEPESPGPAPPASPADGWWQVDGRYPAPSNARRATIQLQLGWTPHGDVRWSDISLAPCEPPPPRPVRIAAVHRRPRAGCAPAEKPPQFAPLIEDAARRGAHRVVPPETLTDDGTGRSIAVADCAEPVPGPSTDHFGALAIRYNLDIVAGLVEHDGPLVFNVAVLVGPDRTLIGKYRKLMLPRTEVEAGVEPGGDYPVFETRFRRLGIMVCDDGVFSEVARALALNGAEIIAWPVWGCDPVLTAARAGEHRVWLIRSAYTPADWGWMPTAIHDPTGRMVAQAKARGTLAFAEIDLEWRFLVYSLGDFRAEWPRHRPPVNLEWPDERTAMQPKEPTR